MKFLLLSAAVLVVLQTPFAAAGPNENPLPNSEEPITDRLPGVQDTECIVDREINLASGQILFASTYCLRADPFDFYLGISTDTDRECEIEVGDP